MLFLCGIGWASSTIIIKIFIGEVDPYHLMFGRFIFAFLLLLLMKPEKFIRCKRREAVISMTLGVIIYAAYATAILSLKYTTAAKSGFLIALPVVLVPILQLMANRVRPNKWVVFTAGMSVMGLYLVSDMDGIGFNFGDLLAMLSSLAYSIYIMIVDKVAKTISEYTLVQYQLLTMSLLSLVATGFVGGFHGEILVAGAMPIIVTGLFGTAMTLYFQVHAQKVASPESVGLLLLTEPILTFFMAWIILEEAVSLRGLIGGAIIIAAMVTAIVKKL